VWRLLARFWGRVVLGGVCGGLAALLVLAPMFGHVSWLATAVAFAGGMAISFTFLRGTP
jgi:hypothetical protein